MHLNGLRLLVVAEVHHRSGVIVMKTCPVIDRVIGGKRLWLLLLWREERSGMIRYICYEEKYSISKSLVKLASRPTSQPNTEHSFTLKGDSNVVLLGLVADRLHRCCLKGNDTTLSYLSQLNNLSSWSTDRCAASKCRLTPGKSLSDEDVTAIQSLLTFELSR